MKYELECGCSFTQYRPEIKEDGLPSISIDFDNLRDCPSVWDICKKGKTKGIFQLETNLGRGWAKKIQPFNIEEMAALISLMRPGALESYVDGKNLTSHYALRKAGKEECTPIHPSLSEFLRETNEILVYQEQILRIVKKIGGYSMVEAENFRKILGKKKIDEMQAEKNKFIDKCEKTQIVDRKEAEYIFSIIEASQRYLFNASHAVGYSKLGYYTLYAKYHFPLHFYTAYLAHARDSIDPKEEIEELIDDMKDHGIDIYPPRLENNNFSFNIFKGGINFGIDQIKSLGERHAEDLIKIVREKSNEVGKDIKNFTWLEFLIKITPLVNKTVVNNLILVGATPDSKVPRKRKAFEYKIFSGLTDRELKWFNENYSKYENLTEAFKAYCYVDRKNGGPSTSGRLKNIEDFISSLVNPSLKLKDEPEWIINNEKNLLGVSLSYNQVDSKDIITNHTISDFLLGNMKKATILVHISNFREHLIKNSKENKKMAFLKLRDSTGYLDGVVFSQVYEENKDLLYNNNIVIVEGRKSDKNDNSIIIDSLKQV